MIEEVLLIQPHYILLSDCKYFFPQVTNSIEIYHYGNFNFSFTLTLPTFVSLKQNCTVANPKNVITSPFCETEWYVSNE